MDYLTLAFGVIGISHIASAILLLILLVQPVIWVPMCIVLAVWNVLCMMGQLVALLMREHE